MPLAKPRVAYFCMEYGLHEQFHTYAGGLGILAGDILKAARDAGDPFVGVGILWRQGYTTQHIDEDGRPFDSYYEYRYNYLEDTGVTVDVMIRAKRVHIKVWRCTAFGNVPLYLLDTFLTDNPGWYLTGQLYGWFEEQRLGQEMILGIGGVRALRALGIDVDVYHFNDSHPVFAGVELIHEQMERSDIGFDEALAQVSRHIVFTTHTPVAAGNEVHEHRLLKYLGAYDGLTYEQMARLGGDPFSMTAAGLRLAKRANAVSQLHGQTARAMWHDVPGGQQILAITNGVHNGTWQDPEVAAAAKGQGDLWSVHMQRKRALIEEIEKQNGVSLDESVLTLGFARRAAPYKRGTLIFTNRPLMEKLLGGHRLQIVFSGKAHPNDIAGKLIIKNIAGMARAYPESVVFLEDYDMRISKLMTRGCDVWLNNPIRPMEASGTSGMKAAMNGVLNFSTLDGWWPEACQHGVNGWQIGCGTQGKECNIVDPASLYEVLTGEIIPTYYDRREQWLTMMRASIEMATWRFSAARMLQEYYDQLYT